MLKQALKSIPAVSLVNAGIKGLLQEGQAYRLLAHYRARAQQAGIRVPDEAALRRELRRRIAARRPGFQPKRPGELHVFLAYYVSSWERVLPTSLEPFGRVSAFNWREHGFNDRGADWLQHRDRMNAAMLAAFRDAGRLQPVDAVVGYLSGNNTDPETLQQMGREGALVFNFCWDDKLHFPGPRRGGRYTSPAAIAHAVDLNLTNAPDSVVKYAVHGGQALFWPEAAHPDVHRPCDLPFDYDVSFVGAKYGWRPAFIRALRARGISVTCFGSGWEGGRLSDEEMVQLYSRSRINLGFGGVAHSRRLMCLKGRDFEVPMSGGLYLTQDNPELALVYDTQAEIATYRNADDCAATIKRLLADPAAAAAVRQAGRRRCLRDHTYAARWQRLFEFAGLLAAE